MHYCAVGNWRVATNLQKIVMFYDPGEHIWGSTERSTATKSESCYWCLAFFFRAMCWQWKSCLWSLIDFVSCILSTIEDWWMTSLCLLTQKQRPLDSCSVEEEKHAYPRWRSCDWASSEYLWPPGCIFAICDLSNLVYLCNHPYVTLDLLLKWYDMAALLPFSFFLKKKDQLLYDYVPTSYCISQAHIACRLNIVYITY